MQIFSPEEEKALMEIIISMAKVFYGLDKLKVRTLAYRYAAKKGKNIPQTWQRKGMAGEAWLVGFRKRMGNLSLRKPESTSLARAMAFNRHNVNLFFEIFKEAYERLGVLPTRIWNIDETGVNTVPNSRQILCQTGLKQVGQIKSGERGTNVSMCCCISASGNALPPAYIFPRMRFKSSMLRGAPAGSLGLANQSGWMNCDIFPEVLHHFIKNMAVSKENPGILILDNHGSHYTWDALLLAREHGLSLATIPPHCSHKMQPLDVGVFGPFKRFYTQACDDWHCSNPGAAITIHYVAELSNRAYVKAFNPENITSSFRRTGIFPLNTEIFTEDEFLPSTVTDRDTLEENFQQTGEQTPASAPEMDQSPSPTTATEAPSCSMTAISEQEHLLALCPLPKARPKNKARSKQKKISAAIITDSPFLKKHFSERFSTNATASRQLFETDSTSEKETPVNADITEDETFIDALNDNSPTEQWAIPKPGDFVVGKVHSFGGSGKLYVGKILSGPDEDNDYDISYLERSRKIKCGFIFPEVQDMASISEADIIKVLPPPEPLAQTKRLRGVFKFASDLSLVQ